MAKDAKAYALWLLSRRARSRLELGEKLALKGFPQAEIEKAVERLSSLGYINDSALARELASSALRQRHLGREGARRFLRQRGIPDDASENALCDYDESGAAGEILKRRIAGLQKLPAEKARRRLAGYLSRRGHSGRTVSEALKKLRAPKDEGNL